MTGTSDRAREIFERWSGTASETSRELAEARKRIAELELELEAAKEAAFADYSARIMSAIEPAGVVKPLKRYEPVSVCSEPDMHERENGDWVRYDDVARIMSAIEPRRQLGDITNDEREIIDMLRIGAFKVVPVEDAIEPAGVGVETQPPSTHLRVTAVEILREWFGGERYARDHEYLDANFGRQAQQVVDWVEGREDARLEALARRHEKALQVGAELREALERYRLAAEATTPSPQPRAAVTKEVTHD